MNIALWVLVGGSLLGNLILSARITRLEKHLKHFPCYQDLPSRRDVEESKAPRHRSMLDGLRPDGTRERN